MKPAPGSSNECSGEIKKDSSPIITFICIVFFFWSQYGQNHPQNAHFDINFSKFSGRAYPQTPLEKSPFSLFQKLCSFTHRSRREGFPDSFQRDRMKVWGLSGLKDIFQVFDQSQGSVISLNGNMSSKDILVHL